MMVFVNSPKNCVKAAAIFDSSLFCCQEIAQTTNTIQFQQNSMVLEVKTWNSVEACKHGSVLACGRNRQTSDGMKWT